MMQVLTIQSSLFGTNGVTSTLLQQLTQQWSKLTETVNFTHRDVSTDPLPHLDAALLQSLATENQQRTAAQQALVSQADQLIAELQRADVLVLTAPLYNFNIPSTLKAWFDHIARAKVTFRYTEQGPEGLLQGKKALILMATGGVEPNSPADIASPYLKLMLNFIGITDIEFVYAAGVNRSQHKEQAMHAATQQLSTWLDAMTQSKQEVAV